MTTMDNILMCSFITIFMGALETVVCRVFSSYNYHETAGEFFNDCVGEPSKYLFLSQSYVSYQHINSFFSFLYNEPMMFAESIDAWSLIIIPALFVAVSSALIVEAIRHRRAERLEASHPHARGVHDSLMLITHAEEVAKVDSKEGWRDAHNEGTAHLVEETIDDINSVDEFMKETKEILPVEGEQQHHHHSSRSQFGNGV